MEKVNPVLVPQRKLSNNMVIPGIGMGTFGNDRYTAKEVSDAVYGAIEAGYRLFDCAAAYGNEKDIGEVFARAFSAGIVDRQELTIMTKVWNDMHGKGDVLVACAQSLRDLVAGIIWMSIWCIGHFRIIMRRARIFPKEPGCGSVLRGGVYVRMEADGASVDMGLVRSIGMSNMTIAV